MNDQTKEAIIALLNESAHPVALLAEAPHDYASLRDCILQMELQQEIEVLRDMLLDLSTFEEKFRQRCAFRETATEQTVPFSDLPESTTNELYWQIAALVFKPVNMGEMLRIVVPRIKTHISVSLPENTKRLTGIHSVPEGFRESVKHLEPIVEQSGRLDALTGPPTMEAFTHYVLSGDGIFHIKDIVNFPLRLHSEVHRQLHSQNPKLAEKLYTHNDHLRTLAADILILNNKGITPKTAIEQLIHGLILGGSRITASNHAGQAADDALKRFFRYFNALESKESLRALKHGGVAFGDIIDTNIERGGCVETTASWLKEMLQKNINYPVLNAPPRMSPDDLKKLEDRYKAAYEKDKEVLDSKKCGLLIPTLPAQLTKKAIQRIAPKTLEELIVLILNFPPAFYDAFWEHVTLDNPAEKLQMLAETVQRGFFNLEQKQALATAIIWHYPRFMMRQNSLLWTTLFTDDPVFLRAALISYQEHQRLDAVKIMIYGNIMLLHHAAYNSPAILETILMLLPEDQRVIAVKMPNQPGMTTLHYAAHYPEGLKAALACLPEDQRLDAVKKTCNHGNTVLHCAHNPESMKVILALYPPHQRLDAVKLANNGHVTVLDRAANSTNSKPLTAILAQVPENHRLALLRTIHGSPATATVLDSLAAKKAIISSSEDEFKDSFVPDFIKIYIFLKERQTSFFPGYFIKNEAKELLTVLKRYGSLDEIKNYLNDYANKNRDTPIVKGLLSSLGRTEFANTTTGQRSEPVVRA